MQIFHFINRPFGNKFSCPYHTHTHTHTNTQKFAHSHTSFCATSLFVSYRRQSLILFLTHQKTFAGNKNKKETTEGAKRSREGGRERGRERASEYAVKCSQASFAIDRDRDRYRHRVTRCKYEQKNAHCHCPLATSDELPLARLIASGRKIATTTTSTAIATASAFSS